MRTLFLIAAIGFNVGYGISQYNDDLKRLHEQEIKNQILKDSIKFQPKIFYPCKHN